MTFDVILQKQVSDGFIARPVLWPDSVVHGATEEEALRRVRTLIRELLSQSRFVKVKVDVDTLAGQIANPWVAKAGMFVDDPTWDDFLQAMADYRHQLDEQQEADPA
jgi:hypothetical protein